MMISDDDQFSLYCIWIVSNTCVIKRSATGLVHSFYVDKKSRVSQPVNYDREYDWYDVHHRWFNNFIFST